MNTLLETWYDLELSEKKKAVESVILFLSSKDSKKSEIEELQRKLITSIDELAFIEIRNNLERPENPIAKRLMKS